MDFNKELELKNAALEIHQVTIKNIESFYNYRTIDDDFKLVTSILSNNNELLELEPRQVMTSKVKNIYEVLPENKLKDINQPRKIKSIR